MADGFLGRWSQRKQAVREGKPVEEPVVPAVTLPPHITASALPGDQAVAGHASAKTPEAAPKPLPPTHQDVELLTQGSDFSPYMAREVAPDVRNAAMKKLFTDPHYNVMDQLDIYIDDYSKPDPLPQAMLRQMVSAQFLNLFDDEAEENKTATQTRPKGTEQPHPTLPQDKGLNHDHTDL